MKSRKRHNRVPSSLLETGMLKCVQNREKGGLIIGQTFGRRVYWGRSCQHKSWPHILFQPLGGRGSLARLYRQHNPTYGTVFGADKDYFQLSFFSLCITVWKYLPLSPASHVVKHRVITALTNCVCAFHNTKSIHYFRVQADTWIYTFAVDSLLFSCLFDSFFLKTTLISVAYMGSDSQQPVSLFYLLKSFSHVEGKCCSAGLVPEVPEMFS